MSPEWVQVRMRRTTYARLRAFGTRTEGLVVAGRMNVGNYDLTGHLSADALVAILLDRDEAHQRRSKKRRVKG